MVPAAQQDLSREIVHEAATDDDFKVICVLTLDACACLCPKARWGSERSQKEKVKMQEENFYYRSFLKIVEMNKLVRL